MFCARLAEGADFSERGIVSPSVRRGQEDSGDFQICVVELISWEQACFFVFVFFLNK